MSQMGMQMPGARRARRATPNVYTVLMIGAVACLIVAIVVVGQAAMDMGPADKGPTGALTLHEDGRPIEPAGLAR